jgi:hypothetical protein
MDLRSAHRRLEEKTKRRFSRISRIFGMSVYHLINVLFSLLHATVALTSYVCWRVVARVSPFIAQRMKKGARKTEADISFRKMAICGRNIGSAEDRIVAAVRRCA